MRKKKTRLFVPLVLCGRVWRWMLEDGQRVITAEIPMRKYGKSGDRLDWEVKHIPVTFERRVLLYKTGENAGLEEVYYICNNNRVRFEDFSIPVIN